MGIPPAFPNPSPRPPPETVAALHSMPSCLDASLRPSVATSSKPLALGRWGSHNDGTTKRRKDDMSKRDREKLRKAKARKDKKTKAAKAARAEAKDSGDSPTSDQGTAFTSSPFGVDSVGRSTTGGGAPRLPRRSKKG